MYLLSSPRREREMRSVKLFPLLLFFSFFSVFRLSPAAAASFQCTGKTTTCQAMIGYTTVNATTYTGIKNLFQVKSIRQLFGANNLSATALPTTPIAANTTVRIPFPCTCSNGNGTSSRRPFYTVVGGDDLDHIARDIFAGFVTYQEIAKVNNITDPNKILVGQKVWIPLPCSCDLVDDVYVVHYAHKVAKGSSVESIASEFNTTAATVMKINGISDAKTLRAEQILDVPLRACSSSIKGDSLDSPLLVPSGSYVLTANNCVQCSCSSATYQLQCVPITEVNNTKGKTCPASTCSNNLTLGSTQSVTSTCDGIICAYAGYNKQTIFTTLANITCNAAAVPGPSSSLSPSGNPATRLVAGWQGLGWMEFLVFMVLFTFL